jgi:hypothetical protein
MYKLVYNSTQGRRCTYNVILRDRYCNHWCIGKAIYPTYSEGVFAALDIQHVICHMVNCYNIVHIISQTAWFWKWFLKLKCVF